MKKSAPGEMTFAELTALVEERLPQNKRLRRNIPGGGRLRIDRQLPFLCVYRKPDAGDVGTSQLVTTEGSYLVVHDPVNRHAEVRELCRVIASLMQEHYGVFLLIEVWSEEDESDYQGRPHFGVWCSEQCSEMAGEKLELFKSGLERIQRRRQHSEVEIQRVTAVAPPKLPPLDTENWDIEGLTHLGLSARPIYRSQRNGVVYPLVLNGLRRRFSNALRRAIYDYTNETSRQPTAHFHSLGPSQMVKATRLTDQKLVDISESFDFLLQVSPLNAEQAWQEFSESGFRTVPEWHYRPLPYHPSLLKRNLFELPIEHIEDATLAQMFGEKQDELDRQITALANIGSPRFLYDSIQLYGTPDASLVELSERILKVVPPTVDESEPAFVFTEEIAEAAREQIDYYHRKMPEFNARVEMSTGIASGLLVSRDRLHVSVTARIRRARLLPLMHHEVGTHLLTYFNGTKQPLRQLHAGLAGYEELQEGLAVLAEYLAGGLTSGRMRTLAGRVIAARMMIDGAAFADTFDVLHRDHQLSPFGSFSTTMRAYRGGGLTKDAIYLRGLRDLLAYLAQGHDIEPLYVGKIGLRHVPLIQQLRRREIVQPPAVLPRLWEQPGFQERLENCRKLSILDLIKEPS